MFEALKGSPRIIVTGAHRSGTTIATEMIAHDTGMRAFREEAFGTHSIAEAEYLLREQGGVVQGPYLLPWVPVLSQMLGTAVVYVKRDSAAVEASNERLRERGISAPYFTKSQADRLWEAIRGCVPFYVEVRYEDLASHPLWAEKRDGWGHRQTRPGERRGR